MGLRSPASLLVDRRSLVDRDDCLWCGRLPSEAAMWADRVVVAAPLLDDDLGFAEGEVDLPVFGGERLVHFMGVSLECDGALEAER